MFSGLLALDPHKMFRRNLCCKNRESARQNRMCGVQMPNILKDPNLHIWRLKLPEKQVFQSPKAKVRGPGGIESPRIQ